MTRRLLVQKILVIGLGLVLLATSGSQLLQQPAAAGAGCARPRRHHGEEALGLLRAAARNGQRLQRLLPRRQSARRDDLRARRLASGGTGWPADRLGAGRERGGRDRPADRRAVGESERVDHDAAGRRLPARLLDPDRLGIAHVPHGRPVDESRSTSGPTRRSTSTTRAASSWPTWTSAT